MSNADQLALEAAMMELTIWVEQRGSTEAPPATYAELLIQSAGMKSSSR
jgi:hypothetical protein